MGKLDYYPGYYRCSVCGNRIHKSALPPNSITGRLMCCGQEMRIPVDPVNKYGSITGFIAAVIMYYLADLGYLAEIGIRHRDDFWKTIVVCVFTYVITRFMVSRVLAFIRDRG